MSIPDFKLGILVLAAVEILSLPAPAEAGKKSPPAKAKFQPMVVRGVRVMQGNYAVILETKDARTFIPIWIGRREAQAIQMRLDSAQPPRPLTHDLLESVLAILGARVERVEVDDLRQSVFIGKLNLRDARGKRYRLDGRPSDLITLAVGAGLPIHVAVHVLKKAGIKLKKPSPARPRPSPKAPSAPPPPAGTLKPTSL